MVAITVILVAVIGTFVLGLGDSVSYTAPSTATVTGFSETVTAGDTATVSGLSSGDTIRVVYKSSNGERSYILAERILQ